MAMITAAEYAAKFGITVNAVMMKCARGGYTTASHDTGKWMIDEDEKPRDARKTGLTEETVKAIGHLYRKIEIAIGRTGAFPTSDMISPVIGLTQLIAMAKHEGGKITPDLEKEIGETLSLVGVEDIRIKLQSQTLQGAWIIGYYTAGSGK